MISKTLLCFAGKEKHNFIFLVSAEVVIQDIVMQNGMNVKIAFFFPFNTNKC